MADHYAVLGVRPDAPVEEIRRAWIRAARRWHPDQIDKADTAADERAQPMMRAVNEAWHVLGDTQRRADYDRERTRGSSSGGTVAGRQGAPLGKPWEEPPDSEESPEEPLFITRSAVAAMLVRALPWILLAAVIVTILIVTAFASSNRAERRLEREGIVQEGIEHPTCVSILVNRNVRYVPCTAPNDGVLDEIVALSPDAVCRNAEARPFEVAANRRLCIVPG